jgi:nicotinamidase-related amidase
MSQRIWDKFLTERDKAVFAAGGFGARAGFDKRPALLVIDVNWAFCGERPEPILESIKRWRTSCGEESWAALEYVKQLIEAARAKGLPVIYTTGERRSDSAVARPRHRCSPIQVRRNLPKNTAIHGSRPAR